ncbi:MAG TPA: DUF2085 domain-containing protein [Clostridiales bacterium]|nr:DUF2085 domain-containing protein [Clostridiales bacterium]
MHIVDIIYRIYKVAGSLICHQIPSRTIYAGGIPLPLCARDTGIYMGLFSSLAYIYLRRKNKSDSPPDIKNTVLLCCLMLLMIIDGGTSYLGIRNTNNIIRYFSGAFFGLPLPFFLLPAAYYNPKRSNMHKSLDKTAEIILLIIINITIGYLLIEMDVLPWILPATATIASLIYIITRTVYTVVVRTQLTKAPYMQLLVAGGTLGIILIMFFISTYILQPLKDTLLR